MNAGNVAGKAEQVGRRTENSEWFDKAVRFGLVVYGMVYLVLAWLGIQLAMGDQEGKATTKGAVAQLAEQPFGTFMIVLVAVGMFLLVLWRLFDLFLGHHEDDGADLWKHRASRPAEGDPVRLGVLGGDQRAHGLRWRRLGREGLLRDDPRAPRRARCWLTLIGLAIIVYGGNQIYLAWNEKHQKKLATEGKSGEAGKAYMLFGKIGYIAKGIAVGLVGGALRVRRVHPGPAEVRQHGQGAPQGAAAAVRAVAAGRAVARDRLLRPLPVRPRPAPREVVEGPGP